MSDNTTKKGSDTFDDLSAERPLHMEPLSGSNADTEDSDDIQGNKKKSNVSSAVKNLTKDGASDLSAAEKDNAQHMRRIKNILMVAATVNTVRTKVHTHKYMAASKKQENLETSFRDASRHVDGGQNALQGRSVEEIILEERMKKNKKHIENMQKKWPDIQRPQTFGQKTQHGFKSVTQGIKSAVQSQSMKGIVQSQGGSDRQALAESLLSGYTPGAEAASDDYSL